MKIAAIQCRTNTGEQLEVPIAEILQVLSGGGTSLGNGLVPKSNGSQYIASGISVDDTGQIKFDGYGSERAFTGIATGLIGFTNDSRLITLPLQQTSSGAKVSTENQTGASTVSTQGVLPFYTDSAGALGDTDILNDNGNYSVGGQGAFWKWDVNAGSINIDQRSTTSAGATDGYRINGKLVLSFDPVSGELTIGNVTYQTTNIQYLKTDSVEFNTTPTGVTAAVGKMSWDTDFNTLQLGVTSGYNYELGQSGWWYCKAGEAITKGDVLYASGAVGASGKIEVSKYIANGTIDESLLVGVAAESATTGTFFPVVTRGEIRGVSTSAYSIGTTLYASTATAGVFQSTMPTAPNKKLPIAFVVSSHAVNGAIYVRAYQQGLTLNKLHNVNIASIADKNILFYSNANSRWENGTFSSLGLASGSGTTNYVTKWNNTTGGLVNSQVFDNGTNVGIGTINPLSKLHSVGRILSTTSFGGSNETIGVYIGESVDGNSMADIDFRRWTGVGTNHGVGRISTDFTGDMIFFSNSSSMNTFATSERIRIKANGNVGIGTTSPSVKLQVDVANVANTKLLKFSTSNNANNYGDFSIQSAELRLNGQFAIGIAPNNTVSAFFATSGNVGIGTVSPSALLDVNGLTTIRGNINVWGGNASNSGLITANGAGGGLYLAAIGTNQNIRLVPSGTGFVQATTNLTVNGNLGVGSNPSSYKFEVIGTGHFTGAVTFDTVPSSLQDATSANHLVRYSQFIAATYLKPYNQDVKTVSLTSLTKSGLYAINGYTPTSGQYVLDAFGDINSGIWVVSAGAWTRATDADTDPELRGFVVSISQGTYAGYKYYNTNTTAITMGSTPITYSVWSNISELDPVFTAWRDTTRTANTFWVAPNGSSGAATWRSIVAADIPTLNQSTTGNAATATTLATTRNIAMTGDVAWSVNFNGSADVTATGTLATITDSGTGSLLKITRNTKGLITGTQVVVAADIPELSGYYVNRSSNQEISGIKTFLGVTEFENDIVLQGVKLFQGASSGTAYQVYGSDGTNQAWTTLTTAHISDLASYTGLDGRYVDLTTNQLSINGNKGFLDDVTMSGITISKFEEGGGSYDNWSIYNVKSSSDGNQLLFANETSGSTPLSLFKDNRVLVNRLIIGVGLILSDASNVLNVDGNIGYSGILKPNNTTPTAGQFLKAPTTSTNEWATIGHADISNLASFTGFDARYYTETESDARFVALAGSYANPTWITELAWSKISGIPSTFAPSAHTLDSHSNVTITSNTSGELLMWNGSAWVNRTLAEAGIQPSLSGTGYVKISGTTISYDNRNFVDLTTTQTGIAGIKEFTTSGSSISGIKFESIGTIPDQWSLQATKNGTENYLSFYNVYDDTDVMTLHRTGEIFARKSVFGGGIFADATESVNVNGNIKYSNKLKPNNIAGTNGQFLSTDATKDIWTTLTVAHISDISTTYQPKLNGTGFVKISGTTISYDNSTYLTTTSASSTYQAILPSGDSGQFLTRNSSGALTFMNLELEPQGLSYNKIAVGDSKNYLSEYNNFEFREGRYLAMFKSTDPNKAFFAGMYGTSNNSFVTASGGSLILKGDTGIYLDGFTGFGPKMVFVDGDGKLGYTDIPTGGTGGGTTSLNSEYIGFGSPINLVTGTSKFKWIDDRVIRISSASASNMEIGRKIATDTYGLFVSDGDIELYTNQSIIAQIGNTGQFKIGDRLKYFRNTNGIQLDSDYNVGEYLSIANPVGDVFWVNAINAKLILGGTEVALGSTSTSYMTFQDCKINWELASCVNGWSSGSTPQEGDEVTLIFSGGEFKLKRKI